MMNFTCVVVEKAHFPTHWHRQSGNVGNLSARALSIEISEHIYLLRFLRQVFDVHVQAVEYRVERLGVSRRRERSIFRFCSALFTNLMVCEAHTAESSHSF